MKFRDRVYGLENEFGTQWESFPDIRTSTAGIVPIVRLIENSVRIPSTGNGRIWHSNGASTYVDTGSHPEHATAECRSVRDLVAHNKAGESLAVRIFSEHPDPQPLGKIYLYKNNYGYDENGFLSASFGCHENYLIFTFDCRNSSMVRQFAPFLATRQIIDGAGTWQWDGNYHFSARASAITTEVSDQTTRGRPLIHSKATADTGSMYPRLHLILGDANIMETAIFLKIGMTSLVLSLIEEGCAPEIPCYDFVQILHDTAATEDPCCPFIRSGEQILSPHTIQCRYLEQVRRCLPGAEFESERTEAEVYEIVRLWEDALNAIYASDEAWMVGRLDWATKKYLAERHIKRVGIVDPSDKMQFLKDFDIFYHSVTDRSLQEKMNRWWPEGRIVSDQDIERAMVEAPSDTRARMRGEFVRSARTHGWQLIWIDWTLIGESSSITGPTFVLRDPFCFVSEEFDSFLEHFSQRPPKQLPVSGPDETPCYY